MVLLNQALMTLSDVGYLVYAVLFTCLLVYSQRLLHYLAFLSFYYQHYRWRRVITKLPNSEQSYKGKVKTHKYINRQNQSTTGKLWKPKWPWLATGISKEMVGWIKF